MFMISLGWLWETFDWMGAFAIQLCAILLQTHTPWYKQRAPCGCLEMWKLTIISQTEDYFFFPLHIFHSSNIYFRLSRIQKNDCSLPLIFFLQSSTIMVDISLSWERWIIYKQESYWCSKIYLLIYFPFLCIMYIFEQLSHSFLKQQPLCEKLSLSEKSDWQLCVGRKLLTTKKHQKKSCPLSVTHDQNCTSWISEYCVE